MSRIKVQTLKGFRDFLPGDARKRQYVINILKGVFESFGFEPLETPALEYEEILLGKYGAEGDKLMYRFTDNGDRRVALRYDQTVPLARVVAQYQNQLPTPFKRYQIQPVWRAENTQKGRFREFLQCDIDTVGLDSLNADAEVIACAVKSLESLGFKNFKVLINDRENLKFYGQGFELTPDKNVLAVRSVDKLKKIGKEGVLDDLIKNGFSTEQATFILQKVDSTKPTQNLNIIFQALKDMGIDENKFEFSPTLARGLDYYTGLIFEIEIDGYEAGSVGGGGRYDNLIGMFAGKDIPAVGMAFGFDRVMEAMESLNLFPKDLTTTKVLVTVFNMELMQKSIEATLRLRSGQINCEIYLEADTKLEKQLKYADLKGIPYVIIIGPDEAKNNQVTLKNLKNKTQEVLSLDEAITNLISQRNLDN